MDDSIKQLQDRVYTIFKEFHRICEKYSLRYSMEGGTLLGAVKYQNFVPWDDDIDIIMVRKDYNKFLEIAPKELDGKFYLQSYNNVPDFPLNYAKICLNNTMILDYQYSHITDMHHGLFIDIFPIDNCKYEKSMPQRKAVGLITSSRTTKLKLPSGGGIKTVIRKTLSLLPIKTLNSLITFFCTLHNKKTTKFRYEMCNSTEKFDPMPYKIYEDYVKLPFRDGEFWAVKEYDYFLKHRFGENYMSELPPEESRKISHFHKVLFEDSFNE